MNVILAFAIFWTVYGILGLLGFQIIPQKYKNHSWTKAYIRRQGISWLMIGIPWFALYFWDASQEWQFAVRAYCVVLFSLPSLIYTFITERKFRALLKEEAE